MVFTVGWMRPDHSNMLKLCLNAERSYMGHILIHKVMGRSSLESEYLDITSKTHL